MATKHAKIKTCDMCGKSVSDNGDLQFGGSPFQDWFGVHRINGSSQLEQLRKIKDWDVCSIKCLRDLCDKLEPKKTYTADECPCGEVDLSKEKTGAIMYKDKVQCPNCSQINFKSSLVFQRMMSTFEPHKTIESYVCHSCGHSFSEVVDTKTE